MYTITVSEKGGQQSTFEFNKPEITIGRMKGNDIVLPKGNVSKRHSRIFAQENAFKIIDLESTNGTYVNGRKITGEQPISENDKIYIGDFILQVEPEEQQAVGPPAPPPGNFPGSNGAGPAEPAPPVPAPPPPEPRPALPSSPGLDIGLDIDLDDLEQAIPDVAPVAKLPPAPSIPAAPLPPAPSIPTSPSPPSAPRLGATGPAHRADDATVDRPADRIGARPQYSQVSAIVTSNELESEFDAALHAAQHDVAVVLFESVTPQDLPIHYPPAPEDQDRFRKAVEAAVKTVNPKKVDREELIKNLTNECVGLGPIDRYLDDSEVRDIYVNRFDFVLIRRSGDTIRAQHAFSHPHLLLAAAYRLLGPREMEVFTDEMRFNDGTRVHVMLPPLSPEGAAITVRKPPTEQPTLDDLIGLGALSSGMAEFLTRATEAGRSIVIAGPTGAGKSTLLSALTRQIPTGVRIVAVDNGSHLQLPENSVRLEPNPAAGFEARYLIHAALAMHPQRIVLDECRGAEAYDWVTAAACGTEGSMATLHGTSATEALGRMESLCLMGSSNVSPRGLREQIARAVNIVVVVNRIHDGGFRVHQITEVQGVDLDAFRLNDVFYYRVEGSDGGFHPTGYVPLFFEDMRHAGIDVDFGIFRE